MYSVSFVSIPIPVLDYFCYRSLKIGINKATSIINLDNRKRA